MSLEQYVLKHYYASIVPSCMCGCGATVKWHKSMYKFNDYITGHNPTGFRVEQPVFTIEQVKKRNENIRKTYENNGTIISKKISDSLSKTLADPNVKEKMSEKQKKMWSNVEYKEKMTETRKRVWAENYDEMCAKIFTPEFSKKISNANMKRDVKHTSKQELDFITHLKNVFGDENVNEKGKWLNDAVDGSAHFDTMLLHEGAWVLIEWDGMYYHGLDRDFDFTAMQLTHIANDYRKNRMAARAGMGLLRVKGDANLLDIVSYDSLIGICRHVQTADGTVIRDGMFQFRDDEHAVITRDTLIKTNETSIFKDAVGRRYTEEFILPALKRFLLEYTKARGWIYPNPTVNVDDALLAVSAHTFDITSRYVSSLTNAGSDFLKQQFKSFWDVDDGPVNSFLDPKRLDKVLRYRLGLNNSKMYDYRLANGQSVSCHETFDINPKNIRRGLIVQRNAVSWFKPTAAFEIYRRCLGDNAQPVVWDPSCGFGARLLGFASAYPSGTYIGTDPATKTFSDLVKLREQLVSRCKGLSIELYNVGSESFTPTQPIDLVFTSPPYFSKERYFDEPTQCWKLFSNVEEWLDGYIYPTVSNALSMLRPNGLIVLNVERGLRDPIIDCIKTLGLRVDDELLLNIGRHAFSRKLGVNQPGNEPILMLKRVR